MELSGYLKTRDANIDKPFANKKVVQGSMNSLTENTGEKEAWVTDKKALMFTVTLFSHKPKYKRRI